MKQIKRILYTIFFTILIYCNITLTKKADLIAFSYDRPMQLYALLESIDYYVTGLKEVHVIYRSTDKNYQNAYQKVIETFPYVFFHKQGKQPKKDFKPLTLKAAFKSHCEYILFAVDDIIIKDFIDIEESIDLLEQTNAYGFYFRLGKNLNCCYALNRAQPLPNLQKITDSVYAWRLKAGQYDWGYPHTVDMTLYKKDNIKRDFKNMNYYAPNPLEGQWSSRTRTIKKENKIGLCYKETKIVNLPINKVQSVYNNRHMDLLSAKELLEIFNQELKIDIAPLFKIQNKSAHMDYTPEFIARTN